MRMVGEGGEGGGGRGWGWGTVFYGLFALSRPSPSPSECYSLVLFTSNISDLGMCCALFFCLGFPNFLDAELNLSKFWPTATQDNVAQSAQRTKNNATT